jgi:hypothetical protein
VIEKADRTVLRPPPILGGAVIFLWGIMTGNVFIGALFALLYESHRVIRDRWDISDELFERIWQFCFISFLVFIGVGIFRVGVSGIFYLALIWTPALLLPLVMAQVYSERDSIPIAVFSMISQYVQKVSRPVAGRTAKAATINIEYFYLLMVLLSASGPNRSGTAFFFCAAWLTFWAIWHNARRPKISPWIWAFALIIVTATGYYGQVALRQLHLYLEDKAFFLNYNAAGSGNANGATSIGSVGKVKLSPAIRWRVRSEIGNPPDYLRTGMYNMYMSGTWFVRGDYKRNNILQSDSSDDRKWIVRDTPMPNSTSKIQLLGKSGREEARLALPGSPVMLDGLAAESVSHSQMGVFLAYEAPRLLNFHVSYIDRLINDPPPSDDDLYLSEQDHETLDRIPEMRQLADLEPRAAIDAIAEFFRSNFTYTTYLTIKDRQDSTALSTFLEKEREGHCEYFATATAILLRKAGIPARYTVGYSVSEYDQRRKEFLVRGLHAHAWTTAWVDGRWQYIDNTPPDWNGIEDQNKSFFQPVMDWLSGMPHALLRVRETPAGRTTITALKWAGLPLLALYLWVRLFRGQKSRRSKGKKDTRLPDQITINGADSECYAIEKRLTELGEERPSGQPLRKWWTAISKRYPVDTAASVDRAIDLHYRHRFSNNGLSKEQREELRDLTEKCLSILKPNT